MNNNPIYTTITLVSLFMSGNVIAHDPSKHATPKKKPNCEAMHEMDSSAMDMDDPIMQAMMQQCGEAKHDGHHEKKNKKPTCTQEHAALGHCKMDSETGEDDSSKEALSEHKHD